MQILKKLLIFIALLKGGLCLGQPTLEQSLKDDPEYKGAHMSVVVDYGTALDPYSAAYNPLHRYQLPDKPLFRFVAAYLALRSGERFLPYWSTSEPPPNSIAINAGTTVIRQSMIVDLVRKLKISPFKAKSYVDSFFKAMDLRGAGNGFSGLIFFQDFVETFQQPEWIEYAIALEAKIEHMLMYEQLPPKNIFDVALEVTHSDSAKAIKLLGLLLSRDSSITNYFSYFPNPISHQGVRAITRVNLLVRAYTEWVQWKTGAELDLFAYPIGFAGKSLKNYYFWSNALLAQKMIERGVPDLAVNLMSERLTYYYKFMRRYLMQNLGLAIFGGAGAGDLMGIMVDMVKAIIQNQHFEPNYFAPVSMTVTMGTFWYLLVQQWPKHKFVTDRQEVLDTSRLGSQFAQAVCNGNLQLQK